MSEFKLIARYLPGLKVVPADMSIIPSHVPSTKPAVSAICLEKALENGMIVRGAPDSLGGWWNDRHHKDEIDTHEALLIGIQEIQPESAEDLLRDVIEHADRFSFNGEAVFRARAFLQRNRK